VICEFCHHEFADGLTECPYCHKLVDVTATRMSREERDSYDGETIEIGADGEVRRQDDKYQTRGEYGGQNDTQKENPAPGVKIYRFGHGWLWLLLCLIILVASFFFLLPAIVIIAAIGAAVYFFCSLFF